MLQVRDDFWGISIVKVVVLQVSEGDETKWFLGLTEAPAKVRDMSWTSYYGSPLTNTHQCIQKLELRACQG